MQGRGGPTALALAYAVAMFVLMSTKGSTGAGGSRKASTGKQRGSTKYTILVAPHHGTAGGAKKGRASTLTFGSVQAKTCRANPSVVEANIASGQAALKRAKTAFTKTGVSLRHRKDVPVFSADPHDPTILIRRLDGREERGRFVNGAFVAG